METKNKAKKSCFAVYTKGGRNGVYFDRVNAERIPYNENPIFLGIPKSV